jgi:hypothetical protein
MQRSLHRRKWKFDDFDNSKVSGVALHFIASAAQEQRAACGNMRALRSSIVYETLYILTHMTPSSVRIENE